jgi:hypothetical protein
VKTLLGMDVGQFTIVLGIGFIIGWILIKIFKRK